MPMRLARYHRIVTRLLAGPGLAVAGAFAAAKAGPAIVITNVPPYGSPGNLSGQVLGADVVTNCVAVFIYVAGDWYAKPSCAAQLTPIRADGAWSADISTGGSDVDATEVAAFLVPTNYDEPCVDGAAGLTISTQVEATAYANRIVPGVRQFNFSGYSWTVKTSSDNLAGPGPNYFSDSTNNVWMDAQGALHLEIVHTNNAWTCAEVISDRSFGYGQYRFTVTAPVDTLDANAVLGLFTYSDDAAYNDREVDIELSRWDYAFGPTDVVDYAVAPYGAGQILRFSLPAAVTNSNHSFIWQSNNIVFQSLNGCFASPPISSNILQTWNCTTGVPPSGGEQVHMNLWLDNGNPPANGQPVAVIISQFEYVPPGPPPPAELGPLTLMDGGLSQITIQTATDWRYQMFSSSNLSDWLCLGSLLATNGAIQFTDTNPPSAGSRFYRALTNP